MSTKAAAKNTTKVPAKADAKKASAKKAPVIRLEKKAAEPPMKIYIQSPYGGQRCRRGRGHAMCGSTRTSYGGSAETVQPELWRSGPTTVHDDATD